MNENENSTKLVRLDKAMSFNLEYLAKQLGKKSVNEVLMFLTRPIIETTVKAHAKKLSVEILKSGSEPSVSFVFSVQENWIIGTVEDYARIFEKYRKASGQA
jgi:hypothetical protein